MKENTKKYIEIGIMKDLYEQKIITEEEMTLAITNINRNFERKAKEINKIGTYYRN